MNNELLDVKEVKELENFKEVNDLLKLGQWKLISTYITSDTVLDKKHEKIHYVLGFIVTFMDASRERLIQK